LPALALVLMVIGGMGCRVLPDKGLSVPASDVICQGFDDPPRVRVGCFPSSTLGSKFLGKNVGSHGYYYSPLEKNGIVYTCRAGHVDIAHVRIAADWTAYLTTQVYRHLMNGDPTFSYKLTVDRSREYVGFAYPSGWDNLTPEQRSTVAADIATHVGPYLAFTMTTWHEILTWFGFKCTGLPTEFPSAFSWEDSFSNLLGTVVAAEALQDPDHSYNEAVTLALDRELTLLGLQPGEAARRASESVKGQWSVGEFMMFLTIQKRNFDIGLGDGMVTPSLVPSMAECPGTEPLSYPAPRLDVLAQYGFAMTLEIEPHEWESGKILRIAYAGEKPKKRISPPQHFPVIMAYIRAAAAALYPEFNYTAYEDGTPPHIQTADRATNQFLEESK